MAKTERRQAIAPIIEDTTDEIREISNPLLQPDGQKEEIDRYTILLPKSKFKRIRMAAVEREVPIKKIFEEMLDDYWKRTTYREDRMDNKEFEKGYSLQEAAELLGRSVVTVRRYVKNGTLEASKLGGKYIIPAAEVKKYL